MTTTGPMPVVQGGISTGQRRAVLEHMGALCNDRLEYGYATADAVIDPCHGVLYIAADQDPDPGDWDRICTLIAAVGWDNGSGGPHRGDPGEPEFDALSRVCTWRLEWAPRCAWCDGKGVSYGCPLCERIGLGYAGSSSPGSFSTSLLRSRGSFFMPVPRGDDDTHVITCSFMTASQQAGARIRSHSQLNQYTECPRSFELSRVERIKRRPGPWFPAGTAVHATIERYLRAQLADESEGK